MKKLIKISLIIRILILSVFLLGCTSDAFIEDTIYIDDLYAYSDNDSEWVKIPQAISEGTGDNLIWLATSFQVLDDQNRTVSLDYTDLDLTAYTSANAKAVVIVLCMRIDTIGTATSSRVLVQRNGDTPIYKPQLRMDAAMVTTQVTHYEEAILGIDNGQVMEYKISVGTGWQVDTFIWVLGYIE